MQNTHEFLSAQDKLTMQVFGTGSARVSASQLIEAGGLIYSHRKGGILRRRIQNVGTVAIKGIVVAAPYVGLGGVVVDTTPIWASAIPHFILAAGAANDDGLGGAIELDAFGHQVYIWAGTDAATAFRAILFEAYHDYTQV